METEQLALAYERLVAAATEAGRTGLTEDQRAQVDWTLGHVVLSDRMLTDVAWRVRAGREARIDNGGAMDERAIAAVVATSSHDERTTMVANQARALLAVIADTATDRATTVLPARLVDRTGTEVFSGEVVWGELLSARANHQIPGHAARLEGFVRPETP
jgi:hypothetical protein